MKLSKRITGINSGGSDGWEVFYRARQMIADGTPVLELTQGEHDIGTSAAIIAAMNASAMAGKTGYSPVQGASDLRRAVADRIQSRTGVATTPDNILITPGGQAGLFASHYAVINDGDTALFIDPYYATYPGTLRSVGAIAKPVVTKAVDYFAPQESALDAAAKGATSLLINSPNNPTGVIYNHDTMMGIARVCTDHDLWLISDEVYDTQIWQGTHLTPRALPDMAPRTMVVGSMSKSHAMTGSRVGWICADAGVIENIFNLANNTTYGVSSFIQDAALFALNQGHDVEENVSAPFRRRRDITLALLDGQNTIRVVPSQGAMYMMLDIRATGMSGLDFAYGLLEAEHIAVMPGESFGSAAAGHIRVAMTIDDDSYRAALSRLMAYAQSQVAA